METKTPTLRVGMGYDVHRFGQPVEECTLHLGGVEVPFDRPLLAHSDGDVLLHAVMDAMLGAAARGDIGDHFPDTDPDYEGADSLHLLKEVGLLLRAEGYELVNLDATLIGEAPKVAPHKEKMVAAIAGALQCAPEQVNVKGTTTEHLGFTGRGEGLAAQAICLLTKN